MDKGGRRGREGRGALRAGETLAGADRGQEGLGLEQKLGK